MLLILCLPQDQLEAKVKFKLSLDAYVILINNFKLNLKNNNIHQFH